MWWLRLEEVDIERMKADPVYFCEEILGIKLSHETKIALLFWVQRIGEV